MKILIVTTLFPYPQYTGFQRVSSKLMESLAENHEVHLASLYPGGQRSIDIDEGRRRFGQVVAVKNPWKGKMTILRRLSVALKLLLPHSTYQEVTHHNRKFSQALQKLQVHKYDLIICEAVWLLKYGKRYWPDSKLALHEHVVDSEQLANRIKQTKHVLWRHILKRLYLRLRRLEDEWIKAVDVVLANSNVVKTQIEKLFPKVQVELVPIYFDERVLEDYKRKQSGNSKLIFMGGSFSWYPNEEGGIFFCKEVCPALKKRFPDCRVLLVGPNPSSKLKKAAEGRAEVLGFVPDIYEYIVNSDIVVCPIFVGGGARIKVMEAMALGMPVVTTLEGVLGIDVVDGIHVMIANSKQEFVSKIGLLLENRMKANELGMAAKRFVMERYSLVAAGRELERVIEDLVSK